MGILGKLFGMGPKVDLVEEISKGAIILDVRSKGEFQSGHVKGSVNIPVDSLERNMHKLKDKDRTIITCCASGMRSGVAKSVLRRNGYTNVHNGGSWMKVQGLKKRA